MSGAHWTEEDFVHHLYGIGPDGGHLDTCGECRARASDFAARHARLTAEPEVSTEFLATQRRGIYRRLGREPRPATRLMPAFAVILLVLLAILVMRPGNRNGGLPVTTAADNQLFSEIYALEQSPEPEAVQTVQGLFEEN